MLTVHVLGRVEVRRDGTPVDLGGPQQRAVIAHLALEADRVVSVERLIDRIWGDDPPRTPVGTLQSYVSRLRRAIEPGRPAGAPAEVLVSEAAGYRLALVPEQVDHSRFAGLVDVARSAHLAGDPATAVEQYDQALALWTGEPLSGIGPPEVVAPIAARLEDARAGAVEDRFEALLALGRHHEVVAQLQAAVEEQPLRERRWAQLALALYRSSRQSEALRALASAREVLAEELGLDPGPELQALERRILDQDADLMLVPDLVPMERVEPRPPSAADRSEHRGPELIGRRSEWSQLVGSLDAVEAEGTRLAIVVGEPGIGKSTICRALQAEAEARGWHTATGRCVEAGLAPSLWPCIELVRDMFRLAEPGSDLLHRLVVLGEPSERTLAPVELADLFVEFIDEQAGDRWVLWLDDLHWGDQPTLDLLRLVLERLGSRRVLVLAAHRPVETVPDSLLGESLGAFARATTVDRVAMSPLDREGVESLLERVIGAAPPAEVVERVHLRAAGNPLFVAELGRLFDERGAVDVDAVPDAIRDVVRRRLAPLPPNTRAEIEVAAVVGERFDLATVMAASDRDPDSCLDALDVACVTQLLVHESPVQEPPVQDSPVQESLVQESLVQESWRFSHALVREAVLAEISPLRRARLHHRVAEALTGLHGTSPDVAEPIAHHRLGSLPVADRRVVAAAAVRAADVARWRRAFDSAESYAEQALAVVGGLPRDDEVARIELDALHALAGVSYLRESIEPTDTRSSGSQSSGGVEARVAALAERIGSDAVRALALFLNWGDIDEVDCLDETDERTAQARELAARTDDAYAIALTNYMIGSADLLRGRIPQAVSELRKALDATVLAAMATGTASDDGPTPGGSSPDGSNSSVAAAEVPTLTRPSSVPLPAAPVIAAIAHALAGDRETALDLVERYAPRWMGERARVDRSAAVPLAFNVAFIRAVLDEPEPVARMTLSPELLDRSIEALAARLLIGWARARTGDPAGIDDALAALADYDAGPDRVLGAMLRTCVAATMLESGDGRAVALLERADADARTRGEVWWLPETLRLRALADRAFGTGASAPALEAEARRLAREHGSVLLLARLEP
ncbi:MAG TPA: BTAD domain-containing putative transcriptional regulator [Ilumatobacter sp.]|nr:BTAD domain-containing putative transcriptional regulator [Ilumatobacter sp.]